MERKLRRGTLCIRGGYQPKNGAKPDDNLCHRARYYEPSTRSLYVI